MVSVSEPWSTADAAQRYGRGLLCGDRVRLRELHDEDLPLLTRWWADPEWGALQQLVVRPQPQAAVAEMFRSWSANPGGGPGAGFSVVATGSGELLGHVTLHGPPQPARIATFAVLIGPDHVGRGHGAEATRLMVRYGFEELGLHKIELRVWSYNQRAIRCYRRAGFVVEGERRAATFHAGRFHGETMMGVLAEEFAADHLPDVPS